MEMRTDCTLHYYLVFKRMIKAQCKFGLQVGKKYYYQIIDNKKLKDTIFYKRFKMSKRTVILLLLNLFTASLFSQISWEELENRDGLVYAPGIERPYSGKVLGSYDNGNNK